MQITCCILSFYIYTCIWKKNVNTLNFYKYLMYRPICKICNEKNYMESLIQKTNANRMVKQCKSQWMDFCKASGWTFYFVKMPENQFLTRCPASWRWDPACERRGVSLSVSMVRNSDPLSPAHLAPIWPTSNRILKNKKCLIYSMFKIHENNYRSFVTTMKAIKKREIC